MIVHKEGAEEEEGGGGGGGGEVEVEGEVDQGVMSMG